MSPPTPLEVSATACNISNSCESPFSFPSCIQPFCERYKSLSDELLSEFDELETSESIKTELKSYYQRLFNHTVNGGKLTRGLTVLKALEATLDADEEGKADKGKLFEQAQVLGWCVEWLQAFFLTADDVMDNSLLVRRSLPCWYKMEGVTASNAINDSLFLNCCITRLLKRHLADSSSYRVFSDLFQEMIYNTVVGQHLDTNAQPVGSELVEVRRFTMDRYLAIVKYKTAFYSFYLPCVLGMTLGGLSEPSILSTTKEICLSIGEYFQIQDDVLDCFASPEILGKVGTDIEEKKCTWLVVKFMERASEEEIKGLQANYGSKDPAKVEWVKNAYTKHQLQAAFDDYENETCDKLRGMVATLPHSGLRGIFTFLLDRLYKRTK